MKPRNIALVSLWMAGALLCFSGSALAVRSLIRTLSLFDILALRNETGLLMLVVGAALHPPFRSQLRPRPPGLHLLRNALHFGGQYCWFYAVAALPLATAFALEFTAPIWLALIAVVFLGERITTSRLGAVVLGLVGALIILRPGHEAFHPAAVIMLAAALAFAGTAAASKRLTQSASTFTILLWMNLLQLVFNAFTADWLFPARIESSQFPAVLMLAVGGLGSHVCLLQAYRHGDAVVVMPLDFLRIPLIAVIGWLFYGEALDIWVFGGAAIIIVGILWNLTAEARTGDASTTRTPG